MASTMKLGLIASVAAESKLERMLEEGSLKASNLLARNLQATPRALTFLMTDQISIGYGTSSGTLCGSSSYHGKTCFKFLYGGGSGGRGKEVTATRSGSGSSDPKDHNAGSCWSFEETNEQGDLWVEQGAGAASNYAGCTQDGDCTSPNHPVCGDNGRCGVGCKDDGSCAIGEVCSGSDKKVCICEQDANGNCAPANYVQVEDPNQIECKEDFSGISATNGGLEGGRSCSANFYSQNQGSYAFSRGGNFANSPWKFKIDPSLCGGQFPWVKLCGWGMTYKDTDPTGQVGNQVCAYECDCPFNRGPGKITVEDSFEDGVELGTNRFTRQMFPGCRFCQFCRVGYLSSLDHECHDRLPAGATCNNGEKCVGNCRLDTSDKYGNHRCF